MNTVTLDEKVYCFTENEFSMLLSAAGIENLLCFHPKEGGESFRKLSQEELNVTISRLVQSGVLSVSGDQYPVNPEVGEIFRMIKKCGTVIYYLPGEKNRMTYCLYVDENGDFLSAVTDGSSSDYIRLSKHGEEEFERTLHEIGLLYDKENDTPQEDALSAEDDKIEIYDGTSGEVRFEAFIERDSGVPKRIRIGEDSAEYKAERLMTEIRNGLGGHKDDIG